VRIGVEAPPSVPVDRLEIHARRSGGRLEAPTEAASRGS
jgi:hypothetical protein